MNIDRDTRAHHEANELARQGRWELAENACQRLLETRPDRADTLTLLGVIYLQTGRSAQAVEPLRHSIALQSRQPLVHTLLGDALLSVDQKSEALACYEQALQQDARLLPALFGRANVLLDLQQFDAARAAYERVLEHAEDYAEAWFNRGNALLALREWALAAESYERAIQLRPGYAAAYNNRGSALFELQQLEPALTSFAAAIAADRTLAAAHRNRGAVLAKLGRPDESLQAFERALSLNSADIEALKLHADTLSSLRRYDEASRSFAQLLRVDPNCEYVAGALHHAQRWCADWNYLHPSAEPRNLTLAVQAGRRVDHPFSFLAVADDPEVQLRCAQTFVESSMDRSVRLAPPTPYTHERIRVAYVSGDFRTHAVSYLLAGVLEKHDQQRFETIGISLAPAEPSPIGQRMKAAFSKFIDVSPLTDLAAAQLIRDLEVDIAVDLSGHTSSRLNIFGYRPAPIQAQYIGFPGTTGAPFIDYLLADSFVIPPAEVPHYSEQVVYLADCFQANGDLRTLDASKQSRQEVGLGRDAFVFCCFNNIYKLNANVFDIWMGILRRVTGSVLWLFAPGETAARNLRLEASRRDVNPERLIFAGRVPYQAHIARLGLADLFLDTLPFNGGATTSDALWSGVPVLTCCGRSFAARMAGSLLQTVGIPELIVDSWNAYEEKAVELAQQPTMLAAMKAQLIDARAHSPLFDSARFCRNLELAYTQMWQRYSRGQRPESFAVKRDEL